MSTEFEQADSPASTKPASKDDRSVDYLICRECSTPCYVFEMESDRITEAVCTVCGNEDVQNFTAGDLEEES